MAEEQKQKKRATTYEAGCHCGYIKFNFTISPGLDEYEVVNYPEAKDVTWHNDSRSRCSVYRFNTKEKDQLFCPKCGASIGIDFRETRKTHTYGFSARTIYDIDLDKLHYRKLHGINLIKPAMDLSGHYWDEEKQEMK
ncbi:glutathione-dependent formaldehyde-activating enzyme [Poronia punctata]|nr:glutathione-dependent formaldehyde-activating enzyme [Poronia punctata]